MLKFSRLPAILVITQFCFILTFMNFEKEDYVTFQNSFFSHYQFYLNFSSACIEPVYLRTSNISQQVCSFFGHFYSIFWGFTSLLIHGVFNLQAGFCDLRFHSKFFEKRMIKYSTFWNKQQEKSTFIFKIVYKNLLIESLIESTTAMP